MKWTRACSAAALGLLPSIPPVLGEGSHHVPDKKYGIPPFFPATYFQPVSPFISTLATTNPINGTAVIHFDPLSPVNASWSLTVYEGDDYAVDKRICRYAIHGTDRASVEQTAVNILLQSDKPADTGKAGAIDAFGENRYFIIALRDYIATGTERGPDPPNCWHPGSSRSRSHDPAPAGR